MNQPASETPLTVRAAAAFEAYRCGDARAMSDLVDLLTPLLWHTARAQRCDAELAQDAVQTAWLRLVENTESIRDPQAVLGWLVVTVKREVWRLGRGERRFVFEERADRADPTPDPSAAAALAERQEVLWRHVTELSERCRYLLRVVAFSDRPDYTAVSQALGMPLGSIGPTRGRCLAKLRDALAADPCWEA